MKSPPCSGIADCETYYLIFNVSCTTYYTFRRKFGLVE